MALKIASIPVLTGEVGRRFEARAQKAYKDYLRRSADKVEREKMNARYKAGVEMVRAILEKSKLMAL